MMTAANNGKALMLQGTGSNVGKSILVAGLCRAALRRGIKVAPFKPQNMSNNAAVSPDGGEIGRAQALQARACGLEPRVEFNPILLKPETDRTAQIIVNGQVAGVQKAASFRGKQRQQLLPDVLRNFETLKNEFDLVVVEGAGSPAETNLREGDIANMGFAVAANVPVTLVGDIDRGGVIAALVGTHTVLDDIDRQMIRGFIINRFRGDSSLFEDGMTDIEQRTGWHGYGIVPWLPEVALLPPEDAVPLDDLKDKAKHNDRIKIAAPVLSRIANFDDLDPLKQEPNVELVFVAPGQSIPLDSDAVVLLGTKSAIGDMDFLRKQAWDTDILALSRAGKHILGICGGLQLLGNEIKDPEGNDGSKGHVEGLGLLDISTEMHPKKVLRKNEGIHVESGAALSGYEIHVGDTCGPDAEHPFAQLSTGPDGARKHGVEGTYLHGLFSSDAFRRDWLNKLKANSASNLNYERSVDDALDQLAESLESCLDIDRLFNDAR